eukprot:1161060-Pelagomonas_calceolata.AAC.12
MEEEALMKRAGRKRRRGKEEVGTAKKGSTGPHRVRHVLLATLLFKEAGGIGQHCRQQSAIEGWLRSSQGLSPKSAFISALHRILPTLI